MKFFAKSLLAAVLLAPLPALAVPVAFNFLSLKSAYVDGMGRVDIASAEQGKLRVTYDPNICFPDGGCTKMAVQTEVVDPKVVSDARPADGPLVLGLTPEFDLSVGSGFTPDGVITYAAVFKKHSSGNPVRVPLMPNVYLKLGH